MGTDLKKFVNPKFMRTISLEPMRRLLERHRDALEHVEPRYSSETAVQSTPGAAFQ